MLYGLILLVTGCASQNINSNTPTLRLATTTSTFDSGLIDAILPDFKAKTGISVDVLAVGTGEALALGRAADVDVVLAHAREQEEQFIADGYGVERRDVMCNDFVLVGPADDPAGIHGMRDAAEALAQIATAEAPFLSRGDQSGTHSRELMLWDAAGLDPSTDPSNSWYQSIGQGMGTTLTFANEQDAYTLSDRGTWLKRHPLSLVLLMEGDVRLNNPYGVIRVNNRPETHIETAETFINWLTSDETKQRINQYRINDQSLFRTDACSDQ